MGSTQNKSESEGTNEVNYCSFFTAPALQKPPIADGTAPGDISFRLLEAEHNMCDQITCLKWFIASARDSEIFAKAAIDQGAIGAIVYTMHVQNRPTISFREGDSIDVKMLCCKALLCIGCHSEHTVDAVQSGGGTQCMKEGLGKCRSLKAVCSELMNMQVPPKDKISRMHLLVHSLVPGSKMWQDVRLSLSPMQPVSTPQKFDLKQLTKDLSSSEGNMQTADEPPLTRSSTNNNNRIRRARRRRKKSQVLTRSQTAT